MPLPLSQVEPPGFPPDRQSSAVGLVPVSVQTPAEGVPPVAHSPSIVEGELPLKQGAAGVVPTAHAPFACPSSPDRLSIFGGIYSFSLSLVIIEVLFIKNYHRKRQKSRKPENSRFFNKT
jgi:hypothetical protein